MYPSRPRNDGDPAEDSKIRAEPPVIAWTPRRERIRVLLPLPLGPSRPMSSPGVARKEIDFRISLPFRTTRRFDTSRVDRSELSIWCDPTGAPRYERVEGGSDARETRLVAVGALGAPVVGEGGLAHPEASLWTPHDFSTTAAPCRGVV